ncbi:MAG: cysteine--tRNA ligase [Lactobacillaceae bacterium]|jgi:cysteinyl-tRNA synthetase|nr:cysteine--tRNA ligase [Lactobacillaceae bacterium]
MKVYNTASLNKEEFHTIKEKHIDMYVCGPTVYNYIHVGNARSAIAFDTIRRYFEYKGYEVNYVSNFTDVDDKIINRAKEEGTTEKNIAETYANAFFEDTAPLNIRPATTRSYATQVIPEIIDFVKDLIDKGYAYESQGDVYFRARKFHGYGILAHQDLNELMANAQGRLDDQEMQRKEDALDFAVWKNEERNGVISWQSPWGNGRPGWHIECSVMSQKYLGNTIDIHGGGIDLAFPHHTNEIAQSEAHTGQKFVNYWLHNGFVNVNDEKMSKSLGNFTTVHELLESYDDPMVIRYLMGTVQYRKPINYSNKELERARTELNKIRSGYQNLSFALKDSNDGFDSDIDEKIDNLVAEYQVAMDDDFNTQNALASVFELVSLANTYANNTDLKKDTANKILETLENLMSVFGIEDLYPDAKPLPNDIQNLLEARKNARLAKNYQESDRIRNQLKEKGIIVNDTPHGQKWTKE